MRLCFQMLKQIQQYILLKPGSFADAMHTKQNKTKQETPSISSLSYAIKESGANFQNLTISLSRYMTSERSRLPMSYISAVNWIKSFEVMSGPTHTHMHRQTTDQPTDRDYNSPPPPTRLERLIRLFSFCTVAVKRVMTLLFFSVVFMK